MNLRTTTLERLVILAVIALAVAYLAGLRPLTRKVAEQDAPLRELRVRLQKASHEAGLPPDTDFLALGDYLTGLRAASAAFSAAEREARPRVEQPEEVRRRLEEPFLLVEFLNESQRYLEALGSLAQARHVSVTPGLPRGFPRYQPELARPELLWVQLATVNRVIRTAIAAGVREISEVSVEPLPLLEGADTSPALSPVSVGPAQPAGTWTNLRVHTTVAGSVDALARMLMALAMTPEELKVAGLPEDMGRHPALFLDHILIRRQQLDAPEQAQLELVVSTVVANDHH